MRTPQWILWHTYCQINGFGEYRGQMRQPPKHVFDFTCLKNQHQPVHFASGLPNIA